MPTVREDKQENYTGLDHEVLSKYKGIALHCWSFEQTYNFKQGIVSETPNHLTTRPQMKILIIFRMKKIFNCLLNYIKS